MAIISLVRLSSLRGMSFIVFPIHISLSKLFPGGFFSFYRVLEISKQENLQIRIGQFIERNPSLPKRKVAEHFIPEGLPKRTIYRLIRNYESRISMNRKPGSGRKPTIMTKVKVRKLKKILLLLLSINFIQM